MDFLRSKGLPIPEVYAYSCTPENEAGTEYMLIVYAECTDLSEIFAKYDSISRKRKSIRSWTSSQSSSLL